MGPVNMMAIEQSKELESATVPVDAAPGSLDSMRRQSAISKIDETTHAASARRSPRSTRTSEHLLALFGGGKAGIMLLVSPIRWSRHRHRRAAARQALQSVMLLSGGEKALTRSR